MLSEISQRKKDKYPWFHSYMECLKIINEQTKQNKNKHKYTENRLVVIKGKEGLREGEIDKGGQL